MEDQLPFLSVFLVNECCIPRRCEGWARELGWRIRSMGLYNAVVYLKEHLNATGLQIFFDTFQKHIDDEIWLPIPTIKDDNGYQLILIEESGKVYAALYSSHTEAQRECSIVMTDLHKLLDPVFDNPAIDGIVIDPDTHLLFLEKDFLRQHLHW